MVATPSTRVCRAAAASVPKDAARASATPAVSQPQEFRSVRNRPRFPVGCTSLRVMDLSPPRSVDVECRLLILVPVAKGSLFGDPSPVEGRGEFRSDVPISLHVLHRGEEPGAELLGALLRQGRDCLGQSGPPKRLSSVVDSGDVGQSVCVRAWHAGRRSMKVTSSPGQLGEHEVIE
jgi:hypothetical protein